MVAQNRNLKQTVIARLYALCREREDMTFDNNEVRAICEEVGFGNHFDVTKIDRSAALPETLRRDDVFVVHLGREGNQPTRHQFVSGIANGYHTFEPIPEDCRQQWSYQPSILNNINTSESNTLSMGYNQRIIHAFLYGATEVRRKFMAPIAPKSRWTTVLATSIST